MKIAALLYFILVFNILQGSSQLAGYTYYRSLTIPATNVSGVSDFVDFPILISFDGNELKSTGNGGKIETLQGYDIVFRLGTDCSGAALDHEIERYDSSTGEFIAWVRIPLLSTSSDTELCVAYGKAAATDPTNSDATWATHFQGVWHLNTAPDGNGGTEEIFDSSGNGNHGNSSNMVAGDLVASQVGYGLDFDGVDDYISIDQDASIEPSSFSIGCWFKSNNDVAGYQKAFAKGRTSHPWGSYTLELRNAATLDKVGFQTGRTDESGGGGLPARYVTTETNAGQAIDTAAWQHMVGTYDETTGIQSFYLNGDLILSSNIDNNGDNNTNNVDYYGADINTYNLIIGAISNNIGVTSEHFKGRIDELFISDQVLSADWVGTFRNNVYNSATFVSGTGTLAPEINLVGNSNNILNGDFTPTTTDHSDFSNVVLGASPVIRTFTIENTGTTDLVIAGAPLVTISGPDAGEFTLNSPPSATITSSSNSSFQITFTPSTSGLKTAIVTINSNDDDEASYSFSIQGTGQEPEIALVGNSTIINSGDLTPSAGDDTDFGSALIAGSTVVKTFTIRNVGTSNLNLSGAPLVSITGAGSGDFTVTALPGTPVASGGNTTFQVTFDPSVSGTRTATVSIANDDNDENPYTFGIEGIGLEPEMLLEGNSTEIVSGDLTPSAGDDTDFGSALIAGSTVVRTFTIENTGNSNLNLSGAPLVSITGAGSGDFTVTSLPVSVIPSNGTTTFQITFDPSVSGTRTATVSIANDDNDENPYTFGIEGIGLEPEMFVEANSTEIVSGDLAPSAVDDTDFGSALIAGSTVVRTFTIENTGNSNLNLSGAPLVSITGSGDFTVTALPGTPVASGGNTTFQVTFDPSVSGTRTATVSIANDDNDENPYTFGIEGIGLEPEMFVEGNSTEIVSGDLTPSAGDDTDFGSSLLSGGTIVRTFTIRNVGTSNLNLSGAPLVSITGAGSGDFTVTALPGTPVASGGNTTFQVTFDPSVSGTRTATVSIANDDNDEAPYTFGIEGIGLEPEMLLEGNSTEIVSGDLTPSAVDDTDFGSALIAGSTVVRTFTIENTGNSNLNLSGAPLVSITGAGSGDFTVTSLPVSVIPSNGTTTFQITFDPSISGTRTATISIANDDNDESPYTFGIEGIGLEPEMFVEGNSTEIVSGDLTPSAGDDTDFGSALIAGSTVVKTFTIENTGNSNLNLSGAPLVSITGSGDFTVTALPGTPVASGGNTTFQVTFDPSVSGTRTATISIANDDNDENPYTFGIEGIGLEPEMFVEGNSTEIVSGDLTPSAGDDTDFGSGLIAGSTVVKTFTIRNVGTSNLNLSGAPLVSITGAGSGDFTVTALPGTPVASGGNTTFQVTFDPSVSGTRTATVSIANDDNDENPYTFGIEGIGLEPEMFVEGDSTEIVSGDLTPSAGDDTDFGSALIAGSTVVRTFTIENTGNSNLNLSGAPLVSVTGAGSGDFTVTSLPVSVIPSNGTTTFQITFDPSISGTRTATISIANDDNDENPYTFGIEGIGLEPEMLLEGNSTEIVSGDLTPSAVDDTDFGSALIAGSTVVRTFTIENTGNSNLNLSGAPLVSITGAGSGDFTVTSLPVSVIPSNGTTTFQITFDPSISGTRTATISIANDDNDESPYTFGIEGIGLEPEMFVEGNSTEIVSGDLTPSAGDDTDFGSALIAGSTVVKTFTIENTGNSNLNLSGAPLVSITGSGDFTVTALPGTPVASGGNTTFQVTFDPSVSGTRTGTVSITNDDNDENPYTFGIEGTGLEPEMVVKGNYIEIVSGDLTPSSGDDTDFGNSIVDGDSIVKTFSIENIGNSILSLVGSPLISISGPNMSDFVIVSEPIISSIFSGSNVSFKISFNPSNMGLREAVVNISSDDGNGGLYTFAIHGTGLEPEITVNGNGTSISSGSIVTSALNNTNFGDLLVAGDSVVKTFSIVNDGNTILNLTSNPIIEISGTGSSDFILESKPSASINPGDSTNFQIKFKPSIPGLREATVSIISDDIDESVFEFSIEGNGMEPTIIITGNGNNIPDGQIFPEIINNTTFQNTIIGQETVQHSFIIKNEGTIDLNLVNNPRIGISGADENSFEIVGSIDPTISENDSIQFNILFNPQKPGLNQATVTIESNVINNPIYSFNIEGIGIISYPVAINDTIIVEKNKNITIDVQSNDSHPGNYQLSTSIFNYPSNGFSKIINQDSVLYQPIIDFTGNDKIEYSVCDQFGFCDTAAIIIQIVEDNKPIASNDTVDILVNTETDIFVLNNDIDPRNTSLYVTILTFTVNGTISLNGDQSINYNPNTGVEGNDMFSYRVCNEEGLCDTAFVQINISSFNQEPVANNDSVKINQDNIVSIAVLENDLNPNGGVLSLSIVNQPGNGQAILTSQSAISYEPNLGFSGSEIFSYQICNEIGLCDTAFVHVIVNDQTAPIANSDIYNTITGATIEFNVLENDFDSQNNLDETTVRVIQDPDNGGAIVNYGDGSFAYKSATFFVGKETMVYEVCDLTGFCDQDTVFILVQAPESEIVKISQGFSPNGDGINDTWFIEGLQYFPRNQVKIFTRDGNIVFEGNGYDNVNVVWNGIIQSSLSFGNGLAREGTYFYLLDLGNGEQPKKGFIEIKY